MSEADVAFILARPEFSSVEVGRFPPQIPLSGIVKNDMRRVPFKAGDIIVRQGDFGNSAFLILKGSLRVVLSPGLPSEVLGRRVSKKKSLFESLAQLWRNHSIPEVRGARKRLGWLRKGSGGKDASPAHAFIQDIPVVLNEHKTAVMSEGQLFGELAALGRISRTASVFAESDVELLEIRWQGLRELRNFDSSWKRQIDERYRANALSTHLRETPLFKDLVPEVLKALTASTLFETYGSFDWHVSYKKMRAEGKGGIAAEPVIVRQGDYPDGVLLVRAGFARVSSALGSGERTLTYLGAGDLHGIDEIYASWRDKKPRALETSLRAIGYVDVLRVPTAFLEEHIFPRMTPPERTLASWAERPLADDALLEWSVDHRLLNATQAMVIDLDRCTRCDDCVRACADSHDGNPRFVRQGRVFDRWLVPNACMHCQDPVCLIGCPTGAIHRTASGGVVVINDDTCVGCQTCAQSCPYDNILMAETRNEGGAFIIDPETRKPILKATKCDLCEDQWGGPACERACPHDALRRGSFKEITGGAEGR
ncbi:MAG: cyclic nucleotide-binding domain-containing protein [Elusimicrobia bacterium]|nr:cyclic nucleotide-binding domain-containing protein [Elusimicrobiota bacterium]